MYIGTYEIVYATQISLLALEQTTEGSTTSVPIPSTFLGFYIKQNNVIKKWQNSHKAYIHADHDYYLQNYAIYFLAGKFFNFICKLDDLGLLYLVK